MRHTRPVLAVLALSGGLLGLPAATAAPTACTPVPVTGVTPTQLKRAVEVREEYFGAGLVDPRTGAIDCSEVHVAWLNNSSIAATFRGHLVLFDAFFPDHNPGYVPTNAAEMGQSQPEFIVIGHGHYDHADEVGRVLAKAPRARLIGTPAHCDQVTEAMAAVKKKPTCIAGVPRGAGLGARGTLDRLIPGVRISTVSIPHSAADTPSQTDPDGAYTPYGGVPAFRSKMAHPPAPVGKAEPADDSGVPEGDGAEGGDLLYQFRLGAFAFTWHDTTGPVKVGDDTWTSLRALPQTDVEYAAVVAFGTVTNGFRDTRVITEALRSHRFLPLHHDDWNEALGSESWSYEQPVTDALNRIAPERRPRVSWLFDPTDYLADGVRSFDPASRAYARDFPEPRMTDVPRLEDRAFAERLARSQLLIPAVNCAALAAAQLVALPAPPDSLS